jgi:hypothetical protein
LRFKKALKDTSVAGIPDAGIFVIYLPIGKELFSGQFFACAATRRSFPQGVISKFQR